ncbi:hypothetical protein POG22_08250 [Geitlerinema sp. CS-897]|nr:hypothetical protein [Geitlerinema sp. CS-897]
MVNSQRDRWSDDNQDTLDSLVWAIESYSGDRKFAIVFARCNARALWHGVLTRLRQVPDLDLCEIYLSPSATTLYSTVSEALAARKTRSGEFPDAAIVSGLPEVRDLDGLLNNAKKIIEELAKTFPFPLVLHATDEVLQRLVRIAPDIYSRASIEEFHQSIADVNAFIDRTADDIFDRVLEAGAGRFLDNADLNLTRDSQLFWELETARQALANSAIEVEPERLANLEFLLGNAADLDESKPQHYERSLADLQTALNATSNPKKHARLVEKLGCVLYCCGTSWRTRSELDRQDYERDCQQAYLNFKQCIDLFEREGRFDLVAKFINALGDILERQQCWDELQTVGTTATVLHRSHPNAFRLARAYSFVAEAALARQDWQTALDNAQQALSVSRHATPDERITDASESQMFREWVRSFNQGAYYFALARAQAGLGQLRDSLASLETALTKTKPDYEPQLYARILEALRRAYFQNGDYLDAFRLKQRQYTLEHQYGFRAFVGAGRLQPSKSVSNLDLETGKQPETVARAIAASGRLEDVNRLVERMGRVDRKLTVLYGQSGVGKSSLLQAGLVPALTGRAIGSRDVLPLLLQVYADWESRFSEAWVCALSKTFDETIAIEPRMAEFSTQLQRQTDRNRSVVLIFDQFEEFFTAYPDSEARQPFYRFLYDCLNLAYVKVVLSLREDRLHHLLEIGRCIDLAVVNHNVLDKQILYYLGAFSCESAKSVMAQLTAQQSRLYFESALIDRVVEDLAERNDRATEGTVRPIELQIVGAQLQTDRVTTLAQYRQLGERPKQTLVQRYLDDTLADCGPENQHIAQLVLYLLTDENNTRPIKNRLDVEKELRSRCGVLGTPNSSELAVTDAQLELVLQIFVDSGLVFLFPETPVERYQLVHDYLVRYIRQQEGAKLLEKLERLEAERRLHEQKLNRVLKRAAIGAGIAAIATTALAFVAVRFARQARFERQQAELAHVRAIDSLSRYARELASEQRDFEQLLEGLRLGRLLQLHERLHPDEQILSHEMHDRALFALQESLYWVREQNRFVGHDAPLLNVSWHPDGTHLVSVDETGEFVVWRQSGAIARRFVVDGGPLDRVRLSSDGDLFATVGNDGTVTLWNARGDKVAGRAIEAENATSLSWHPDAARLAVGTREGTVEVWQVASDANNEISFDLVERWRGHDGSVSSLQWRPDGTQMASAGSDATVKIWSATAPKNEGNETVFVRPAVRTLNGHTDEISSVRWHPRGDGLATASLDGTIRVWDATGEARRVLWGHEDGVTSLSWRPDGTVLASGSWDGTIKLWNAEDGRERQTLRGDDDGIVSLQWSSNGKMLVSADRLRGVKLWNFHDRTLKVLQSDRGAIVRLSWNPRGTTFATVHEDGTATVWDLRGRAIARLSDDESDEDGAIADVVFAADGEQLLTAHDDGTATVWTTSGDRVATLRGHDAPVRRVAVSPDGNLLATASQDGTVMLWNRRGQPLQTWVGHDGTIVAIAFHPEAPVVATAGSDRTVRLWTWRGEPLSILPESDRPLTDIAWHPDGTILAVGDRDRAIVLWQAILNAEGTALTEPATPIHRLWGHGADVTGLSWHPDGESLASSSHDRTVKLWTLDRLNATEIAPMRMLSRGRMTSRPFGDDGLTDVSFSPDGRILAASDTSGRVVLWRNLDLNLDLETAIDRGCAWVADYLQHSPDAPPDVKALCRGRDRSKQTDKLKKRLTSKPLARRHVRNTVGLVSVSCRDFHSLEASR